MTTVRTKIQRRTAAGTDIHDLTSDLDQILAEAQIAEGWMLLFVPGSTAALTTIEYESGAVHDLERALERVAPEAGEYEHNLRWGDGNGFSHVRAALMGPSLTVPISGGRLQTGTWQQVILCDFDNRPRDRTVLVQVLAT